MTSRAPPTLASSVATEDASTKVSPAGTPFSAPRRTLWLSIALFSLLIALMTAAGLTINWQHHFRQQAEQLQSVGRLKSEQIEHWLEERRRDAQLVHRSPIFGDTLAHWRTGARIEADARLAERLEDYRAALHYESVAIADGNGNLLLQTGPAIHTGSPQLRQAIEQALNKNAIAMTDLYHWATPSPPHAHLDLVAPLPSFPGQTAAAIILRSDVQVSLYPMLQTWPVPSTTAETLLVRRDGDVVLYLNELRHEQHTALRKRIPFSQSQVLAVQALTEDYQASSLIEGIDYRGKRTIGVAYPVAGTLWWIVAKIDRDEIFAEARKDLLIIAFGGLVAWLMASALALIHYQRRELQFSELQRQEQTSRLRALRLLSAIADASTDAIFAKDAQGRYILFNRAANAITGKRADDVLGHDDTTLFAPAQAALIAAQDRRVIAEGQTISLDQLIETTQGPRTFQVSKGPLFDEAGQVIGLYGISRDITGRARNEAALQQRNEELLRFNQAMVGRELAMIELKRRINELHHELGRQPPYDLSRIERAGAIR